MAIGDVSGAAEFRLAFFTAPLSWREFVTERAAWCALHQGLFTIENDLIACCDGDVGIGGAHQKRTKLGFVQRAEELGEPATRHVDMQRLAVAPNYLEVDFLLGDVIEVALQDSPFAPSAAFDTPGDLGKQLTRPG